jgi:hypothetical protein
MKPRRGERREKTGRKKKEFWCDFEVNWTPLFKGGFRN